jgi:hypothetical protein
MFMTGVVFYSCQKDSLIGETSEPLNEINQEPVFVEPSEEIIDGELFIDGISQKEVITDFDLENTKVIDGRLAFDNHEAMMKGIDRLAEYNTESVIAWSEKIGFTSLFAELTRIEEHPVSEMQSELDKGDMLSDHFHITKDGELELTQQTVLLSRIFNTQGLIQVGDFVGSFTEGLNVWVEAENTKKLVTALKDRHIPEDDKDFYYTDKSAFELNKNWVQHETCPKTSTWIGGNHQYKNPSANRRIDVRNSYHEFETPQYTSQPGLVYWIYSYVYRIETTSRKASWNKYKTDHYLNIDVRSQKGDGVIKPVTTHQHKKTEQDNNTKYGFIEAHVYYMNTSGNPFFIPAAELPFLLDVNPGAHGQWWNSGTSASHRGMGAGYGRLDCD